MNADAMKAAQALRAALDGRYSPKRRLAVASITSVSKDASGHVTGAVAVVEKLASVSIVTGFNAAIAKNSQVVVENRGTVTRPNWHMTTSGGGVATPGYFSTPGGIPIVTPAGIIPPNTNLLANPGFDLKHPSHKQPVAWKSSEQTHLVTEMGDD